MCIGRRYASGPAHTALETEGSQLLLLGCCCCTASWRATEDQNRVYLLRFDICGPCVSAVAVCIWAGVCRAVCIMPQHWAGGARPHWASGDAAFDGLVPAACASRVGACCALEWCRPQHLAGGDDATDLSCEEHGTQS